MPDYYQVLGLLPHATEPEVRKAINRELRLWSNRTNAPQMERRQEAERMVKLIEEAERILLDPQQRTEYDRQNPRASAGAPPPIPSGRKSAAAADVVADATPLQEEWRTYLDAGEYAKAIEILERHVREQPGNEDYQHALTFAYHAGMLSSWWEHDDKRYCTSEAQALAAKAILEKARALKFDDPELHKQIDDTGRLVDSMFTRKFKGSWIMVALLSLCWVVPGVLWWWANRRPVYKVNKDLQDLVERGKVGSLAHDLAGNLSEIEGATYHSALPPGLKWCAHTLPRFVVWGLILLTAPFTFLFLVFDNYGPKYLLGAIGGLFLLLLILVSGGGNSRTAYVPPQQTVQTPQSAPQFQQPPQNTPRPQIFASPERSAVSLTPPTTPGSSYNQERQARSPNATDISNGLLEDEWNIYYDSAKGDLTIDYNWIVRFGATRWTVPLNALDFRLVSVGVPAERENIKGRTIVTVPLKNGYAAHEEIWKSNSEAGPEWNWPNPPDEVRMSEKPLLIYARGANEGHELVTRLRRLAGNTTADVATMPSQPPEPAVPGPRTGQRWQNSLGMRFVPVPNTSVLFSVWDTRVQDFETFAKATNYDAGDGMISVAAGGWKQRGDNWQHPGFSQRPTDPVVGINWDTANAFCEWLTAKERQAGLLGPEQRYRLPSDEEWSRAVGLSNEVGATPKERNGRTRGVYPWGTQWPPPTGAGNFRGQESKIGQEPAKWSMIAGYQDGYARTSPVGSFRPNTYGLYDMSGNVWQWCSDFFTPGQPNHAVRGGSWRNDNPADLLSSKREDNPPDSQDCIVGFRCVLSFGEHHPQVGANILNSGDDSGVQVVQTPSGSGKAFNRLSGSRIEYSLQRGFPTSGTLEWRILVKNGFKYDNGQLSESKPDACMFTTTGPDTWYPGSAWVSVYADGKVTFAMADSKGGQTPLRTLTATNTTFRFGEWHTIGISFGSGGRSINVDHRVVAHDGLSVQLAAGGNQSVQNDLPTLGKMRSHFWPNNLHDAGFEGVVDAFWISSRQSDWQPAAE